MNEKEIRHHIYVSLVKLYEKMNAGGEGQYKKFTFDSEDENLAIKIIADMHKRYMVEEKQPFVIRLTEVGYYLTQIYLPSLSEELELVTSSTQPSLVEQSNLQPPSPQEMLGIKEKLNDPDCIYSTRFKDGKDEVFWATDGLKYVTGYTLDELNEEGGTIALIQNLNKIQELAKRLTEGKEYKVEIDIITKYKIRRRVEFIVSPRYNSKNQKVGSISAIKVKA